MKKIAITIKQTEVIKCDTFKIYIIQIIHVILNYDAETFYCKYNLNI